MSISNLIFDVGNKKNKIEVVINLDITEEPSDESIVNGLVNYIYAFEEIKNLTSQNKY